MDSSIDMVRLEREASKREKETLKLYRPTPQQVAFHASKAHELVLRGGKRSGKSTAAAIEFASRILGYQIIDEEGNYIPLRFRPSSKKDPGLYWIIGWDVKHIGQTIHRLLFQPGLFRIIKDKTTGKWRTYNPANSEDAKRFADSEPAPPLIPERLIDPDGWSWENKGANVFESLTLKDGTKICAYPSSGRSPKQGDAVNGIWIDEDIQNGTHLKEWQDRLTDRDGWLIWSVWPHSKNDALIELLDKAEEAKDLPEDDRNIEAVQLVMTSNPYFTEKSKERSLGRMGSDEEIARRDRGELLWESLMMYEFLPLLHVVKPMDEALAKYPPKSKRQVVERHLAMHGRMPNDWTRYLTIDPSHTRTAVLLAAVAPLEEFDIPLGNLIVVERELVLRRHSADMLADEVLKLIRGLNLEAMIMDQNAGRQTSIGRDDSTAEHYAKAFAKKSIKARLTESGFIPGCNVPAKRFRSVRTLLATQAHGQPTMYFVEANTFETRSEFNRYRKKQQNVAGEEQIFDEPANPRKFDCMAAVEYLSEFIEQAFDMGTAYVSPESYQSQGSPAFHAAQKILKKQQQSSGEYVHLGPGVAA